MTRGRSVIAIAGGTCAGKTTLSERLARAFPERVAIISQDNFYPDRSLMPEADLAAVRWDSLSSIDVPELLNCLAEIIRDGRTLVPAYNKQSHARDIDAAREINGEVVLLEGLHAVIVTRLLAESTMEFSPVRSLRIFLDCPERERFRRRRERELLGSTVHGDFSLFWQAISEPYLFGEVFRRSRRQTRVLRHPYNEADIKYIVNWISEELALH